MKFEFKEEITLNDFQNYTPEFLKKRAKDRLFKRIGADIMRLISIEIHNNKTCTVLEAEFHFYSKQHFKSIARTINELNDAIKSGKDTEPILRSLCDLLRH